MTIHIIPKLVSCAFPKAMTPENIRSGFRVTGIYPFDRNIFTPDEFMSAYATDRPVQEVRQPDAPFVADDPSDTSLEEVQQSDTPIAASTSSRTLLGEIHVPSFSASVTPTKILVHRETLRPFGPLETRKEGSTKRKI